MDLPSAPSRDEGGETPSDYGEELTEICALHRPGLSIAMQCAQELFSLFMLAVASRVAEVWGLTGTTRVAGVVLLETELNTLFASAAEEAVKAGIARNMDEACVQP